MKKYLKKQKIKRNIFLNENKRERDKTMRQDMSKVP